MAVILNPDKENERKIGYSVLECLSLDPQMRPYIKEYASILEAAAENLPRRANEDPGLMARGILVNLGLLDIEMLHGPEAYEEGIRLNKGRRKMRPLP